MRLPLAPAALAMLTALAAPALAAPPDSGDYQQAINVFLGGRIDPMQFTTSFAETVTKGLDGKWAPLASLPPGPGFVALLAPVCERFPVTIRTTPEHGFVLTRMNAKSNTKFDVVFTPMGGNVFGQYTAPDQLFAYLGLKEGVGGPTLWVNVLRSNNGTASINRVGDSILVIQPANNVPAIYGRCE
jgi:hypothetical protein